MGLPESCPSVIRLAPIPSSRCDMTKKTEKEENEPLQTAVYIPAMRLVRTLVTFSLCCG